MSVLAKDPTIKLFGKTIPLPLSQAALIPDPPAASSDLSASRNSSHRQIFLSGAAYPKQKSAKEEDDADDDEETSRKSGSPEKQEVCLPHQNPEPTTSSGISENSRTSSAERETSVERETSAVKPDTNGEQSKTVEKTLKKPDKLLPCPRCNSMKTKFCYYNNYNVNQPRHFCKNCQRYWTAGGTMRSVPVGAGRRKNKNSSISPYRQLMLSMSQVHNLETPNASNGTVLSFGSSPSKPQNWIQNFSTDQIGEDHSSRSSITGSNSSEKGNQTRDQEQMTKKFKPFPPQIPTFTPLQWSPQFQPPFFPSSPFPVSFYPIPFWGCSPPSSWVLPSPSPPSLSVSNSPASMPKTLRIDDVSDPARSSLNGGKLFQAFQPKADEKSHVQTSPLLQANPAALSRSIKFHERT